MTRLSLYPVGGSYLLVAITAIALVVLLIVLPLGDRASRPRRRILGTVRLAIIAMLVLAMLRPTLIYTQITKLPATLVLLLDQSRSMTIPDEVDNRSRWDALKQSLADAQESIGQLDEQFEVKAYTFDSELHGVELNDGMAQLPDTPPGKQTAIGHALQRVLQQEAGKRLLGIVLMSDGAQRARPPIDTFAQDAAAQVRDSGNTLHTMAFGRSTGIGVVQDIAVKGLLANTHVFVKNELIVTGQIHADGFVNREIPVKLLFETAPGEMEVVAIENLAISTQGEDVPFEFRYAPQVPGEHKLSVEVPQQPKELVLTNNRMTSFVNVLKGGLNVLYLEGERRVEKTFLRRALDASPDINVDSMALDRLSLGSGKFDSSELFTPGKYAVYILGNVDAEVFGEEGLTALAECVNQGSGLIMLGGRQSFGPGGYAESPLADVLPIRMNRFERQPPPPAPVRRDLHFWDPMQMTLTEIGSRHFALRLAADPADNATVWQSLPALDGANQFSSQLPRTALILAEDPSGHPLLISQLFGSGRVMAFAGDTTWRWCLAGYEVHHRRLWRQIVLWLARMDESMEGNVWIKLPRRRFSPGQRVEFSVGVQAADGQPVANPQATAYVTLPDGTETPLSLTLGDGQLTGSFRSTDTVGDYAIQVSVSDATEILGDARARFVVYEQDMELDNASADSSLLESLATMTDGQSLAPEELPALIQQLSHQTKDLEDRTEAKRTFWDTWPFLLVLISLMGLEWYLRKRWGLV